MQVPRSSDRRDVKEAEALIFKRRQIFGKFYLKLFQVALGDGKTEKTLCLIFVVSHTLGIGAAMASVIFRLFFSLVN